MHINCSDISWIQGLAHARKAVYHLAILSIYEIYFYISLMIKHTHYVYAVSKLMNT